MPFPYCWLHFSPAPALFGMMSTDGGLGPRSSFDCLLTICSSSLCHHLCLPRPPCKTCDSPLQPASSHPIPWHCMGWDVSHTTSLQSILRHPSRPIASHLTATQLIPLSPSHSTIPTPPQTPTPSPQPQSVSTSSAQEQSHLLLGRGEEGGRLPRG